MPLPVPDNMMRVRLRATLRTDTLPVEEAQFGFYGHRIHFAGNDTAWATDVQNVAEGIRDRWNDHITGKALFSPAVVMESVKVDHLQASDGKTIDQGVALFEGADAWVGSASDGLPWETALAVSLFGYNRGAFATDKGRKRGRMYLPPMGVNVLSGKPGQVTDTALTALNTQFGAFFNDVQGMEINDGPGPDADYFDLVVMSIGTPAKPLTPATFPITRIYIDSELDSQRRRQHQVDPIETLSTVISHA